VIIAAAAPALLAGAALGQTSADPMSPAALRLENDRLRERVAELEAELDESRRLLQDLHRLVESLRASRRAPAADPAQPVEALPDALPSSDTPAAVAEIPDDPLACPESMRRALADDLQPLWEGANLESAPERERYLRDARRWARVQQRQRRGLVNWTMRLVESQQLVDGRTRLLFRIVDPASGAAIGEPVGITPEQRDAERVLAASPLQRWRVTALLTPTPTVNPERVRPGVYDVPPLIGPCVEFAYSLDVKVIAPAGEHKGDADVR